MRFPLCWLMGARLPANCLEFLGRMRRPYQCDIHMYCQRSLCKAICMFFPDCHSALQYALIVGRRPHHTAP
ncbi:hypothetical protein EDC04DRAFT_2803378 [Pisolithus marmoratus]|nr:hypothetical protein EDC04DRAFT_2803378 [Pisolithus marmoratus]